MTADRFLQTLQWLPAFAMTGLTGTLAQLAVQGGLMALAGRQYATVAAMSGYCCGFLINYQLNYHHTFACRRPHAATLWRYGIVAAAGLALNALLIQLLVVRDGHSWLPVQVLATGLVFAGNYLGCLHWVFRDDAARH